MGLLFKDISYAQGAWNMESDPDQAVAMKASGFYTGSKLPYLDTELTRNYANAIRLAKVPILYHFAGGADPQTEADYFFRAISPLAEGDLYTLDFEIDVADNQQWVLIFVTRIHDLTGVWPWVYIDRSRRQSGDWSQVFQNCGEWIAAPDVPFDATIPGIGTYIAQQGAIVNGVDTDEFFGTIDALKAYGYHAAAPAAPVVVPEPIPAPTPAPTPVVDQKPVPAPTPVVIPPTSAPVPTSKPVIVIPVQTPKVINVDWLHRFVAALVKAFKNLA